MPNTVPPISNISTDMAAWRLGDADGAVAADHPWQVGRHAEPGGARIGTAEIYRQVESFDEIEEALVVGQDWDNDVRVILFVKMRGSRRGSDR